MKQKRKKEAVFLAVGAFLAGLINTVVGAGGGVFLIFAMQIFISREKEKNVYAVTTAAVMILSLISLFSYLNGGVIKFSDVAPFILPAVFGGSIGALLLGRIKTKHIRFIFAALTLYSGVKMLF